MTFMNIDLFLKTFLGKKSICFVRLKLRTLLYHKRIEKVSAFRSMFTVFALSVLIIAANGFNASVFYK